MRTTLASFALLLLGLSVSAGESAGDRHAKALAPFIDDQTYLIGHLDVSRLDVDFLAKYSGEDAQKVKAMGTLAKNTFLGAGGKDVYVVLNWASPLQEVLVVAPLAKGSTANALTALASQISGYQVEIKDDVLIAGPPKMMARLKEFKAKAMPEWALGFAAVGDAAAQVVFVPPFALKRALVENYPVLPKELGGVNTANLDFKWVALGANPSDKLTAKVVLQAINAQAAQEIGKVAQRGLEVASKDKQAQKAFPDLNRVIEGLKPKVQGEQVSINLTDNKAGDMLLVLVQKQRDAAGRVQSINNLKQLALAMHVYHDAFKSFPAAATFDAQGKPLLSWRVQILPFIEQDALYKEFRQDEPWDSEHNKKLIGRMPRTFASPAQMNAGEGKTVYLAPVGPKTIFGGKTGMPLQKITDGTSNTIMILEVADDRAVYWTQPGDYKIDDQNPAAGLFRPGVPSTAAAFADGSVRRLTDMITAAALRALYTANGGEAIRDEERP